MLLDENDDEDSWWSDKGLTILRPPIRALVLQSMRNLLTCKGEEPKSLKVHGMPVPSQTNVMKITNNGLSCPNVRSSLRDVP